VDTDALYTIMTRLRISPQPVGDGLHPPWATIMRWVGEDHTRMIAVIEVVMDIRTIDYQQLRELERTLSDGGSMYTATDNGIEERVDPVAKQAAVAAMQPNDHASAELSEAWSKAYGRQQDASDSWDHAIKAVEALLVPLVFPNPGTGRIGQVIGQLDQPGSRWVLLLQFNQLSPPKNPPFTLHRGIGWNASTDLAESRSSCHPNHRRTPSIEEARGVLHVAVTIVQWARDGQIVKR
jgi:hypothetical protein